MEKRVIYRLSKNESVPLEHSFVDVPDAFIVAAMFFAGVFVAAYLILNILPLHLFGLAALPQIEIFEFEAWQNSLTSAQQTSFDIKFYLSAVAATIFALGGLKIGFKPKSFDKHKEGLRLMHGEKALKELNKFSRREILRGEEGIKLHPSLPISIDKETKHFMLVGAPGGGKSQTLHYILKQIFRRRDKCIIYDSKADFTGAYKNAILVAPQDSRSWAWDISKDCRTEAEAQELANKFIASSKDPMWSNGARAILVAIIVKLQTLQPSDWDWKDLADQIAEVSADEKKLIEVVHLYNPIQAAVILGGEESKTVQSFLTIIATSAVLINNLAQAWGGKKTIKKISFKEWLYNEDTKHRRIILQGDGRFAELSKAYIGSIISLLASEIQSPLFADSKTRKIWFILDEAPTLGKVDILPMITVGRSKGVRVVAAFQDQSQINEIFGNNVAKTWASSAGTMIIYRVNRGETANWLAQDILGNRTVLRSQSSETFSNNGKSVQKSQVLVNLPVVHPNFLENDLGPSETGVRGLLLGFGDVAAVLSWPYITLQNARPKHSPAGWTVPALQKMSAEKSAKFFEISANFEEERILKSEKLEEKEEEVTGAITKEEISL